MSCKNAFFTRFAVKITESPYQYVPCKKFVTVGDLSVGKEGSTQVREYDKIVEIPDNIRTIPPLEASLLVTGQVGLDIDVDFFLKWYDERKNKIRDIKVFLTDRKWFPILTGEYIGVSLADYSFSAPAMGDSKLLVMNLTFKPYDVRIYRPSVPNGTAFDALGLQQMA